VNVTTASYANTSTSASYALTASYAANGGGSGGAISIYSQGILQGTSSKVNFYGPGVSAYISEMDPTTAVANIGAGVSVTVPNIISSNNIREFEFTSGSIFLTASENYPDYERAILNIPNLSNVGSDILPTTNGVYSLGGMAKSFFRAWVSDSIFLGSTILRSEDLTLSSTDPIITPAISADIANIGSINIIEDTISVDVDAAAEYSGVPSTVKIGSGLKVLGSTYGDKYVLVNGAGTPAENGLELLDAYEQAKTMRLALPSQETGSSANGINTDRITVVVSPGKYYLERIFLIDTEYIDVVSLTGEPDVVITSNDQNPVFIKEVSYVTVRGLNTGTKTIRTKGGDGGLSILVENCVGGRYSFTLNGNIQSIGPDTDRSTFRGRFKNCVGGDYSFVGITNLNVATFDGCVGELGSFACSEGTDQGEYINCVGGNYSFSSQTPAIYGTYTRCVGGDYSFASYAGENYGIFNNCVGGQYSFGYNINTVDSGRYTDCEGLDSSFSRQAESIQGAKYIRCVAKDFSFAFSATAVNTSTVFQDCIADLYGFTSLTSLTENGSFINCKAASMAVDDGNTPSYKTTGEWINCVAANGWKNANSSSIFTNCVADEIGFNGYFAGTAIGCSAPQGSLSFASGNTFSGTAINCILVKRTGQNQTFPTPSSGGKVINCVGGSTYALVNAG
jgi:hypothetical protein